MTGVPSNACNFGDHEACNGSDMPGAFRHVGYPCTCDCHARPGGMR